MPEKNALRRSAIDSNGNVKHHVYVDTNGKSYFSATTVLDNYENKAKKEAINKWRKENDGTNGTDHHEDLLKYSQLRGTLCHARAQEKYSEDEIWGEEEDMALDELKQFGEIDEQDAYEKYKQDVEWFIDEIHKMLDAEIDEVLYIEEYCYHENPDYAGQVDLVYRNIEGDLVVCDLKTSKQVSYSYYLQGNAYAKVIEEEIGEPVDKIQVARANPDNKTSELRSIDRSGYPIKATEIFEDEYGYRVAIDSPYIAKTDIDDLDWELYHQKWDNSRNKWTFTVKNKNDVATIDILFKRLSNRYDWCVHIPDDIKNNIIDVAGENNVHFHRVSSQYEDYGDQLTSEFYELAEEEIENKPLKFPEDLIEENRDEFDSDVVENAQTYIQDHIGQLGDKDPRESCSAILLEFGACRETINKVFDPDRIDEIHSLYFN